MTDCPGMADISKKEKAVEGFLEGGSVFRLPPLDIASSSILECVCCAKERKLK